MKYKVLYKPKNLRDWFRFCKFEYYYLMIRKIPVVLK